MKKFLLSVIDWFYPLFKGIMPLQTYRYAACGGANTLLDIGVFSFSFYYIFHQQNLVLPFMTLKCFTASLIVAFCISFPTGFVLMRYLVYPESNLRRRVQLFRYLLQVVTCILLNYVFMYLFVEMYHIFAPLAKVMTTIIVVAFSYLTQKHFTFRVKEGLPTS